MILKLFIAVLIAAVQPQVKAAGNVTNNIRSRTTEAAKCNNGLGECVPYYLCKDGKINDDGSGLLDIRLDAQDECTDYFEQCCVTENVFEPSPHIPQIEQPIEETCGRREDAGVGFKITNQKDNEAEFGEFPWMAAILREEHIETEHFTVFQCGGSLIHPLVVLTAAHCVNGTDPKDLTVRLGEWDTQTKNEPLPAVDYAVKEVVAHKSFVKSNLHHDIALLFLEKPVKQEPHINTICLSDHQAYEGDECFVSGWGKENFAKDSRYQVILKKIQVPVMPFGLCQTRLRGTRLGKWFKLHDSFMCAGGEAGKDACRGDGGSALVCPLPGKPGYYYQAGIVAWGVSCGDEGIPGVYVNVVNYQLWIEEQLKKHQLQVEKTDKGHGSGNVRPGGQDLSPGGHVRPGGDKVKPEDGGTTVPTTRVPTLPPSTHSPKEIPTTTQPSSSTPPVDGGKVDVLTGDEHQGGSPPPTTSEPKEYVLTSTARPSEHTPPPITEYSCGLRNEEGVGFRITGNMDGEAEYGEFPWMVAVMKEEEAADTILNVYICGGSLIHPLAVLTAAHCVHDKDPKLLVRVGEWDTQTKNEVFGHADHEVDSIVVHENFKAGPLHNDVALLFLKNEVEYHQHISPICLPPPNTRFDKNRCYISGWGKDVFGREGKYQVILKKIDVPVVPLATCQAQLRETRLGKWYKMHESFLCAGGERGKDACRGDGGSPLVCPVPGHEGHYYQAGIVAWGISCGDENVPGVYANVAKFRTWIDEKMTLRHLDTKSYTLS